MIEVVEACRRVYEECDAFSANVGQGGGEAEAEKLRRPGAVWSYITSHIVHHDRNIRTRIAQEIVR